MTRKSSRISEEICFLSVFQQINSSLQERVNEYEADMLHLRQQVKQLELEKSSLSEVSGLLSAPFHCGCMHVRTCV